MGVALPNGNTLASKTEDELIAIGKDYRARLDKIKQDLADKRAAPDLQAEYDGSTPPNHIIAPRVRCAGLGR